MCGICGCSDEVHTLETHHHTSSDLIHVEQDLLAKNNQYADANRKLFLDKKMTVINFMSSPGSGKTTLLAKTILDLKQDVSIAVVVGDQQTDYDAKRLSASGVSAIQVNTGRVCHLDAHMVGHALLELTLKDNSLLFIENVGNLVCPALFDLGETKKVVILSVTEGDNKPLKYPDMFRHADLLILTKIDLLPYVDFDVQACFEYAKRINPGIELLELSATAGMGLSNWYQWLEQQRD